MRGGLRPGAGRPPEGKVDEHGRTARKKIAFYVDNEEKNFLRYVLRKLRMEDPMLNDIAEAYLRDQ